jgi:hypothetical protein
MLQNIYGYSLTLVRIVFDDSVKTDGSVLTGETDLIQDDVGEHI